MLILALDSTATAASVALCEDKKPLAAFHLNNGNTHSETLLPMARALLEVTGRTIADIDLFACSIGPGSFTGVRIGAATVKGLAFGTDKPVLGVSTLEALAHNTLPARGLVCPVMNARRGQVYNALFRAEGMNLTRLCPDRALSLTDLKAELVAMQEDFILCGDGVDITEKSFDDLTPLLLSTLAADQNAVSVATVAYENYLAGARGTDAEIAPVYLRLPQAERERLARQNAIKE